MAGRLSLRTATNRVVTVPRRAIAENVLAPRPPNIEVERAAQFASFDPSTLAASGTQPQWVVAAEIQSVTERAAAATRLHLHEALTSIHTHLPRRGENRPEERA